MNKLLKIIAGIMLAFVISSFIIYRLRLRRVAPRPLPETPRQAATIELMTAEGEITAVDAQRGTLVLSQDSQTLVISFDDRTAALQAGHLVRPAAIQSGAKARVRYLQSGGKNWAKSIWLTPRE